VWTTPYDIGDEGPNGGIVFYDKGDYFDGWRYMEVMLDDWGPTIWWGVMIGAGPTGWAVPNPYELEQMYLNLYLNDLGDFQGDVYWSSEAYCCWTNTSGRSDVENRLLSYYTSLSFGRSANKASGMRSSHVWVLDFDSGLSFDLHPNEEAYGRLIRRF